MPVAKRPHCVSRRRVPSGSGRSSRGHQSRTGTFRSLASLAQRYSVPKLQCAKSRPSSLMSSMSTKSTPSSFKRCAVRFLYLTASGALNMLRLVGANPSLICAILNSLTFNYNFRL